jgi:hypothetical protein
MELRFFLASPLHQIGTRSRDWLLSLPQNCTFASANTTRYALQTLLGLWICEYGLLEDETFPASRSYACTLGQCFPADSDALMGVFSADPALMLFSLGILRFFNIRHAQLELFITHIGRLLQAHSDQSEGEANDLFLTRFLLRQLQLHPPLSSYPLQKVSARDLINAEGDRVKSVMQNIIAATQFGQIRLVDFDFLNILSSLLPVLMLDHFCAYNLEIGMQILRAMTYVQLHEQREWQAGLAFLVAQQHCSGRFGFFAQEAAQMHLSVSEAEQDCKIYLPHTVSFLWTIAEAAHPPFILAQSFQRAAAKQG